MGFLDDLGKSLNKMGKKTSEMASTAKLKLEITKHKTTIDKKYEEIGARVYFLSKEDQTSDEIVSQLIADVDALYEAIEVLEKQVLAITKEEEPVSETCSHCGEVIGPEMKFCGSCGQGLEVVELTTCPNCQAEVGQAKFCNSCGTSLE